jgi:transposase InsO family protein
MDLARYVVEAVLLEGRSRREVARAHGVSKSWVAKMVARYRSGGEVALRPRSKAPKHIPHRTCAEVQEQIITVRKQLIEDGFDAGPHTIQHHLSLLTEQVPSASTIYRILRRRGFITPEPHKRPRSSWNRFEAQLPNECWQSDVTHWDLADETEVEILNIIDDYSRLAIASRVFRTTTAPAVLKVFCASGEQQGFPASVLTDNGCVFTTWHRGGPNVLQTELLARGIEFKHSRPYHPQTCGKVERFHQTLKVFLAKQPRAHSIAELQAQVDRFVAYYNQIRPHRARARMTPRQAFDARDKARPSGPKLTIPAGVRVRRDRIDKGGKLTLRHKGTLYHIGIGRDHRHKHVIMLIAGLDVRILSNNGELLRHFTLDPNKIYQATGAPPGPPKGRPLGPRGKQRVSTML